MLAPPQQSFADVVPSAGGFRILPPPPNLWVPCQIDGSTASAETILRCRPAGMVVAPGDPLLEPHPALHDMPLAPAAGKIIGLSSASILQGHCLPAVEIETAGVPQPEPPELAELPPFMPGDLSDRLRPTPLAQWINSLSSTAHWISRWTCPDLIDQLRQVLTHPIDTVICSILDLDPEMPVQAMIASAWANDLAAGVSALATLTGAGRAWIVIPDCLPSACYARLTQAITGTSVKLVAINNRYPLANPSLLIQTLTSRSVRFGKLPVEQGVLLLDADSAKNAGRALARNAKSLSVPMGIFEHRSRQSHFVLVPIGTPVGYLLEQLGIKASGTALSAGTPLLERAMDIHCVLTGLSPTLYVSPPSRDVNPDPCIRCGWCMEACPAHLQPARLLEATQREDLTMAREFGLSACVECGICTYVCPSQLPLMHSIRVLRRLATRA